MNIDIKFKKRIKSRVKFLVFLLIIILIPSIISSSLFKISGGKLEDNIEKDDTTELQLPIPSSSLPNAEYFNYYKIITIDHTKVNGSVDFTNFPVLISIIDSDLDDKAQFDGDDIAFANNTAWLDHEIELYDPSYTFNEAQLITWIRIPLLSTSSDTSIFMFYGNNTMDSQENSTGVWSAKYDGIWHLKEDPSIGGTNNIKDSTSNHNDGTSYLMGSFDQVLGQIDGSLDFDASNDYIDIGNVNAEIKTIEFWVNPDTLSSFSESETDYRNPTATGETYDSWNNPTNAYTSNNIRASASGYNLRQDYYNFGFNIPSDVNIEGIVVSIEGRATQTGESAQCSVEISGNGGTNYYAPYNNERTWWSTLDSYQSVGGPTEQWNKPGGWLPSDFSNANFRVRLTESGYHPLEIDHVRVKVYYSGSIDMPLIQINGTTQIVIDNTTHEIKIIGFPSTPDIYVDGEIGTPINPNEWYHVVITSTTGIDASAFIIGRVSSDSFDGTLDEVRISNMNLAAEWIITEYNNHYDPNSFYSVSVETTLLTNVRVNAIDLYGNPIPNVNISIIENNKILRTDIADSNGTVIFENVVSIEEKYNFSVSMKSNIAPYMTIEINRTFNAILIEGSLQTINLLCNVSRNIFNVVDADGIPVDSGWIIVGNNTDLIQNCTIDNTGCATFRWLNSSPYQYNYTVWYRDINYNHENIHRIIVGSGDIFTPNSEVNITAILTTVKFTVLTVNNPTPVDGAKLILSNLESGENIINLTSNLNGEATLRWVNSTGINNSNYSIRVSFYGSFWDFEINILNTGKVAETNFTIASKIDYNISIYFEPADLEELETTIVSLNPSNNIIIEWGSKVKIRSLFNVTSVSTGLEHLLGPTYADTMLCQIFEGTTLIHSKLFIEDYDYIGRHQVEIETDELETDTIYILKIIAQKSGYVLPPDVILSLYLLENELLLNQSENDDSDQTIYWQEITNMSVKPYGIISEDFTINYSIPNSFNNTYFNFSIPDISNDWNLSQITFNIYNISWNVVESNINITIVDPYDSFHMFHYSNHSGYNYITGTWKGLEIKLDKSSPTKDNNFEFIIGGSFDGTVDVIADVSFIRDKINNQYSRFNITNIISILSAAEGWAIKNITFELYNCYNTSSWSLVDPLNDFKLNISTNEGLKYSLDSGSLGFGKLTIDNCIIYPIDNQFLFTIENNTEIMFDALIKVEYVQEFYQNQFLEISNLSKTEYGFSKGGTFQVSYIEKEWIEEYVTLEIRGISNGPEYLLPSELAMNITIDGQRYSIEDVYPGQGRISLEGLNKNSIYTAVIETNQTVIFNLNFTTKYSRIVYYETLGTVSYIIEEAPSLYGTVQYFEDLEYYIQTINASLIDAYEYSIKFTITKEHYDSATKVFKLIVLDRPTLLNESIEFFRVFEQIFVLEAVNFTFFYTDNITHQPISDLSEQHFTWERYDAQGNVIETNHGDLISASDKSYILDLNTEYLVIGDYFIVITFDKKNYDYKIALVYLTINERPTLINGISTLGTIYDDIDMAEAKNYTFSYVDFLTSANITNLNNQSYSYISTNPDDPNGQGTLLFNASNSLYVLDLDTETKPNGTYTITIILGKENFSIQIATLVLSIQYIETDYRSYLTLISSNPLDLTTDIFWRDIISINFNFSKHHISEPETLFNPDVISGQFRDIDNLPIGNPIDLLPYNNLTGNFTFIFDTSKYGLIGGHYYDLRITAKLSGFTSPDPLVIPFQVKNLPVELEVVNYTTNTKFPVYTISKYWDITFNLTLRFTEINTSLPITDATVSFSWEYGVGIILPDNTKGAGYYSFLFDTGNATDIGAYSINFLAIKQNYSIGSPSPNFIIYVIERPTCLNSNEEVLYLSPPTLYMKDGVNFTFEYIDILNSQNVGNAEEKNFILQKLDEFGVPIPDGSIFGSLLETTDHRYILDLNTEKLNDGEYSVIISIKKKNYSLKISIISLTISKREFMFQSSVGDFLRIDSGGDLKFHITLTDPHNNSVPIIGANLYILLKGERYNFTEIGNGTYSISILNIDTSFFTSKTFVIVGHIEKTNFNPKTFSITLVIEMDEIFLGIPTFYFILVSSLILIFIGSIVGYRIYKNATIPSFVKKVRLMKKAIEGKKKISDSLIYRDKEVFVGERINHKWEKVGLSVESIFGIKLEKKLLKVERKISESVKRRDVKPIGLLLMEWDERIGTKILVKYPEETQVSEKTLMQVYSTHEYSGEKGIINLTTGLLNILSYYTGPESSYYLLLILKIEDDPDIYEGGMTDIIRIILENIEDDSYLYMIPSLFQRLSLYPSLSDEEVLALDYQDEIKQMIIDILRDVGVIMKSELIIWIKDKYMELFVDLEATFLELIKKDIIKQVSVKGLPSELIVLTKDFFMLRIPPEKLLDAPIKQGLPTQFVKEYHAQVKEFFQNYRPSKEDTIRILEILIKPDVYQTLRLLRNLIVTKQELQKLKTKGVDDVYGALKLLCDNQFVKTFQDENGTEYYALISDFYMDFIFPKYFLKVIKDAYEKKSIANTALTEFLKALEDTYYALKSKKKSKNSF